MSTTTDYLVQAEFSLAAYSQLYGGISTNDYINALIDQGRGMSADQADHFASTYSVAAQYNDPNGLSATVFADATGSKGSGSDYFLCWLLMSRYPASMLMVSPPPCPVGQVTTCGKQFWEPFRFCRCNNIGLLSYIF
ncbi:MAG TPA: hypothetical protein PK372_00760 [Rugosibacter sp.]|jgi:hypothetical protein|nr:hypothetical protein [Rugosibacter sp.]HQN46100.1 hypothetical protein [Rugosibacter sp.]HQQ34455.1 hypothetical protein [Rugosibacter sp.]